MFYSFKEQNWKLLPAIGKNLVVEHLSSVLCELVSLSLLYSHELKKNWGSRGYIVNVFLVSSSTEKEN